MTNEEFEKLAGEQGYATERIHAGVYINSDTRHAFKGYQMRQPEIDALQAVISMQQDELFKFRAEVERLRADAERYHALHTPEISNFVAAIESESLHQRERWGNEHDSGKSDADWFWLVGYLAGKAIRPDATPEKQLHHIITTAAACLNWHAHKLGIFTNMRPGIDGATAMKETK